MIAISTNIHQVTSVRGEHNQSGGTRWFNLWIITEWGQKVEITLFHDEAHEEFFERLEEALKSLEPRPHMALDSLTKFNKAIIKDIQAGRLATIRRESAPQLRGLEDDESCAICGRTEAEHNSLEDHAFDDERK